METKPRSDKLKQHEPENNNAFVKKTVYLSTRNLSPVMWAHDLYISFVCFKVKYKNIAMLSFTVAPKLYLNLVIL